MSSLSCSLFRLLSVMLALFASSLYAAQTIELQHNNVTLLGNLVRANDDKSAPLFVILHGTLAHNKMEIVSAMQTELEAEGMSSLAINLSYSIDKRASSMLDCAVTHKHKHEDAISELSTWITWVKQAGYTNIYLVGHSRGGAQVAWYMADGAAPAVIKGAVLIAPANTSPQKIKVNYQTRYNTTPSKVLAAHKGKEMFEKVGFVYCHDAQVTKNAFASYYKNDPRFAFSYSAQQIGLPLLVVAGSEDKVVPLSQADIDAIGKDNIRFVMIDSADHFFRDLYMLDTIGAIKEWMTNK